MLGLGAVDPDGLGVVDGDLEYIGLLRSDVNIPIENIRRSSASGAYAFDCGGHEAGEETAIRLDGHARLCEGGGDDGMVLREEVEVDRVANNGGDDVGSEGEFSILADSN